MSRLREKVAAAERGFDLPAEGDLAPYAVFTQAAPGQPHVYAGWLDAPDDRMALAFAREHYGRDQECVSIWAVPRSAIAGTGSEFPASGREGPRQPFEVFLQKARGEVHAWAGSVEGASPREALDAARRLHPEAHGAWVAPREAIAASGPGEVVWRLTDQTYRLARGYSASVRDKWEKVRAERDLREYERDDLKDAF
jgi:phenylacetate-CoA oxygenase PaaH subunit